jgi:hypothetical protein
MARPFRQPDPIISSRPEINFASSPLAKLESPSVDSAAFLLALAAAS